MARFFHARHGKTHCPGGSDPIPCLNPTQVFRAWMTSAITLPAGGNELDLIWGDFETTDPAKAYFDHLAPPFTTVLLRKPGIYSIRCWWSPPGTFADNTLYWIAVNDLWSSADTLYQERTGWAQLGDQIGLAWTGHYPPLGETVLSASSVVGQVIASAGQNGGSDIDVFGELEIIFHNHVHDGVVWHD